MATTNGPSLGAPLLGDRVDEIFQLSIVLTNRCNLDCLPCSYPSQRPYRYVRRATIARILPSLLDRGLTSVMLTGGEPCLHPELGSIVSDLHASGLRLTLVTNGTLLRRRLPVLAEKVHRLIISLDSVDPAGYTAIRGARSFDELLSLPAAVVEQSPSTAVTLCVLTQRLNFRELPRFVDLAADAGAHRVSFLVPDVLGMTAPEERGGAFGHLRRLPRDRVGRVMLTLEEIAEFRSVVIPAVLDAVARNPRIECPSVGRLAEFADYFEAYRRGVPRGETRLCALPFHELILDEQERLQLCFFMPDAWPLADLADLVNDPRVVAVRRDYLESDERLRRYCDMCLQAARVQVEP